MFVPRHVSGCRLPAPRYNGACMKAVEQQILETLKDLESNAAAIRTAQPKPNLVPLFQRLDALASELPPDRHGDLRHFLRNGSYEKARLWLEGRRAEIGRGACGG